MTSSGNNNYLTQNVNDNMGSDALIFIRLNFFTNKIETEVMSECEVFMLGILM